MNNHLFSTWVEVDLGALRQNIRRLMEIAGVPVMAVVKANAYGHGLVESARAVVEGGASWLGVARIEEGLDLRKSGLSLPILVLGYTAPERVQDAVAAGISLACYDPGLAQAYGEAVKGVQGTLQVHAKFDSGMGRLGVFPEDGVEFIRLLRQVPGIQIEGMFTHFPCADDAERETTSHQIGRFQKLVDELQQAGLRPGLVHAANSATTLYYPHGCFDLVRCGIAVYGLHPSSDTPLPDGFHPALTWKAHLSSVKFLPPGHGVGYNKRYRTRAVERIGAVACGYADGFRRRLGNYVLVGGRRANVVGGVCMDQFMVQLDEVPDAKIGDEVVLIGKQGAAEITAEEIGLDWGTNNYEVVCGLANRVPRLYIG